MLRRWKTLGVKTVYETPWLTLRLETCEIDHDKVVNDYHVTHYPPVVFVVAVTLAQEVVLVRQYRQGIREIMSELPAGGMEPDEDVLGAAERELLEETGYGAQRFEHLTTIAPNPSGSDNFHHFVIAHGAFQMHGNQQGVAETETIEVRTVGLRELYDLTIRGEIGSTSSVTGVYIALAHLGKVQFRL